jgi:GT2 family glycosyltransferase
VVVPSYNEGERLRGTVAQLLTTLPPDAEVIVVDDGSTDGSVAALPGDPRLAVLPSARQGIARARNEGSRAARGRILVFADAHVCPPPGWWQPLVEALADPAVGAVGPAISMLGRPRCKGFGMSLRQASLDATWLGRAGQRPYQVPVLCAAFLALRRETFCAAGGFDHGLVRWGMNDVEFSLHLWALGYDLLVAPQVDVAHLFRDRHPYHVDWMTVLHNKLRVALVYFGPARLARVIERLKPHRDFAAALALALTSGSNERRAELQRRRQRDDDWFFDRFNLIW